MFKILENGIIPQEIIKNKLYYLIPSNLYSIPAGSGQIIKFNLIFDGEGIASIELFNKYHIKGLIGANCSFLKNDEIQLPIFYLYSYKQQTVADILFNNYTEFINNSEPIAKLWVR